MDFAEVCANNTPHKFARLKLKSLTSGHFSPKAWLIYVKGTCTCPCVCVCERDGNTDSSNL